MLAWEIAKQWQVENCMTPFEEILGAHLSCGLIHSTPEVFLLAQECHWTGTEMVSRRDAKGQRKELNAWFVELAAHSPQKTPGLNSLSPERLTHSQSSGLPAEVQLGLPKPSFVELAASDTFSRRGAAVTDAEQRPGKQSQSNPVKEFMRVATHPHPYVLWYRAALNRPHNLHAYRWDHLARRVNLPSSPLCASAPLQTRPLLRIRYGRENLQSPSPIT